MIYVENKRDVASIYQIGARALLDAVSPSVPQPRFVIRDDDDPDLQALAEAEYFIGSGFDTGRLGQYATRLRVVHCTSAGVERYLPLDWLPPGAVMTNSSGAHAEKGGMFGCMAVLMLNEGMPRHITHQREGRWVQKMSTAIRGKTVVIYGLGSLGEAIAQRLRPFGARVIGIRRSGDASEHADQTFRADALMDLLPTADFLVLTCPLTRSTRGAIGEAQLSALPKGASVLNMARAAVLDNSALTSALISGHLAGAILDVFDPEPLPGTSPLWNVPGLVLTPHISSDDATGYVDRCLEIFGANLRRERLGQQLTNVVDPVEGY